MAARPKDRIWIEGERGRFDRFRRVDVTTDVFGEAMATFEVADDRAWQSMRTLLLPSRELRVVCNGLPVFTGRVDANELPVSCEDGTVIQVVMRTRLADTRIGSARSDVAVQNTSIRDFILALYERHGFTADNFLFSPDTDRDIATGKKPGRRDPVDLEPFVADKAKVLPTETTEAAAKRHLERHHLMLWDSATGLVCVGLPDDRQLPFYRFEQRRGVCNFRSARPVNDWGEVPGEIWVYGGGVGNDVLRAPVRGVAVDFDLAISAANTGQFNRRVILGVQGAKDLARANAQARRELAARSRRKAAWEVVADDWTFWDGARATPYAIATTAEMAVETHAGSALAGRFLVTGVRKTADADSGVSSTLTLLAQGLIDPVGANP